MAILVLRLYDVENAIKRVPPNDEAEIRSGSSDDC
jgi:hypothetical protein